MKLLRVILGCLLFPTLPAFATGACPALPVQNPPPRTAIPAPLNDNPLWMPFLTEVSERTAPQMRRAQIVLLGDSITYDWQNAFDESGSTFEATFGQWRGVNLGLPGDNTQGLLWRLPQQWADARPRVAVLMIGTNNAGADAPADTAQGIAEVVRWIRRTSPMTRIVLLALLPRGPSADDQLRRANNDVNALVRRCADGNWVRWLDVGELLLNGSDRLGADLSADQLHLTPAGYRILGRAIAPVLTRLMQ